MFLIALRRSILSIDVLLLRSQCTVDASTTLFARLCDGMSETGLCILHPKKLGRFDMASTRVAGTIGLRAKIAASKASFAMGWHQRRKRYEALDLAGRMTDERFERA